MRPGWTLRTSAQVRGMEDSVENRGKWWEINELAASRSSQALSNLLDLSVSVEISISEVRSIQDLTPTLDVERITAGIYLPITGEIKGAALLIFPKESAFTLSDLLVKRQPGTTRKLTKLDESALKELGNIICGNYMTVLSNNLQIKIIEHVPSFSFDMFGATLSQIIAKCSGNAEEPLLINVRFLFPSAELEGYLLLLFEREQLGAIVGSLQGA